MSLCLAPAHNLEEYRSFPLHLGRSNLAKWWWSACPCDGASTRQPCDNCRSIVAKNVGFVSRNVMHICTLGILTLDNSFKDYSSKQKNGCVVRVNDMTVLWGKKQLWEGDVITIGRYSSAPWITLQVVKKVGKSIPITPKVTSQSKWVTPEAHRRSLRKHSQPYCEIAECPATRESNLSKNTQSSWIKKLHVTENENLNPLDQTDFVNQRKNDELNVEMRIRRIQHCSEEKTSNHNSMTKHTTFNGPKKSTSQEHRNAAQDKDENSMTTCATSNNTIPPHEEFKRKHILNLQSKLRRKNLFFSISQENTENFQASRDCAVTYGEQDNPHMPLNCDRDATKVLSLSRENSKSKSYLDTQRTATLQIEPQMPHNLNDQHDRTQEVASSILSLPQCPTYHSDKSSDQASFHDSIYARKRQQQKQQSRGSNFPQPLDPIDPLSEFSSSASRKNEQSDQVC
jgi:hypothetical protein